MSLGQSTFLKSFQPKNRNSSHSYRSEWHRNDTNQTIPISSNLILAETLSLSLPFLSPSLSHTPAHSLRCARTHSQSRSNTQAAWHKHFSYLILSKLFQTSHLKSQPLSLSRPLSHSQLECIDWNERERERERERGFPISAVSLQIRVAEQRHECNLEM